ncbi:MAG: PQQ-binding-like beta-propeller repeat protein [bacterium]
MYKLFRDTVGPKPGTLGAATFNGMVIAGSVIRVKPGATYGPGVGIARVEFQHSLDGGVTWGTNRFTNGGVDTTPDANGEYEADLSDLSGIPCGASVLLRARSIDTGGTDSDYLTWTARVVRQPTASTLSAAVNNGAASMTLNWTAAATNSPCVIAGYNLYRTDGQTGVVTKLNASLLSSLTFTDIADLTVGIQYSYIVEAVPSLGLESFPTSSARSSPVTMTPQPPAAPSLLATGIVDAIRLNWSGIVPGYYPVAQVAIFRGITPGVQSFITQVSASPASFEDTTMPFLKGTPILYRVRLIDSKSNAGAESALVSAIPLCDPRTPEFTIVKAQTPPLPRQDERVTYRIVVTNTGEVTLRNLILTDTLPPVLVEPETQEPAPFDPPSIEQACGGTLFVWSRENLAWKPGLSLTFTITALTQACSPVTVDDTAFASPGTLCETLFRTSNQTRFFLDVPVPPPVTNLVVSKTQAPAAVGIGEAVTYRIVATNTGQATLHNLLVTDTLPASFVEVESEQPPEMGPPIHTDTLSGTLYVWSRRGLRMFPGTAFTFTLTGKQGLVCAPIVSCGAALVRGADPCSATTLPTNDPGRSVLPHVLAFDTTKQFLPSPPGQGSPLTYRIVVTNAGTATLTRVDVTDTVFAGLVERATSQPAEFAVPVQQFIPGGFRYAWSASSLSFRPGNRYTFTLTGRIAEPCAGVSADNRAATFVTSACATAHGVTPPASFDLAPVPPIFLTISKTCTPMTPGIGDPLTFRIVVENTGAITVNDLLLIDTVSPSLIEAASAQPPGIAAPLVSGSAGGSLYVWSAGGVSLFPGEAFTFTISGRVGLVCAPTVVENTALAVGRDRCSTRTVTSGPVGPLVGPYLTSLAVRKRLAPSSPAVGGPVTYGIDVTNAGSATLSRVDVVDTVSPFLVNQATQQPGLFAAPARYESPSGTMYVWSASSLAMRPGSTYTFTVTGVVGTVAAATVVSDTAWAMGWSACSTTVVLSNVASFTTPPPNTLANLRVVDGDGLVRLAWDAPGGTGGVVRINLYRREDLAGPLLLWRTLAPSARAFVDLRVENDLPYTYALSMTDANGLESPHTGEVAATPRLKDWPVFQRSNLHEASDLSVTVRPPLAVEWQATFAPIPGGPGFAAYQAPLVVSGTVFVLSAAGEVAAFRADGTVLWRRAGTANSGGGSLVLHAGRLYASLADGLAVIDAGDGQVLWSLPTTTYGTGQESSPIVYKGVLYAGVILDNQFQLVAVDIDPSSPLYQQVLWTRSMVSFVKTSPGAARNRVYFVDGSGTLQAIDPEDGTTIWSTLLGFYVTANPAVGLTVTPPVVVVAHENRFLYGISAVDGSQMWRNRLNTGPISPAMVQTTIAGKSVTLAVVASYGINTVYGVNVITGLPEWTANTFDPLLNGSVTHGSPVITAGRVHLYATTGDLFTLRLSDGHLLDTLNLGFTQPLGVTGHMSAGAGRLFVPVMGDGRLFVLHGTRGGPALLVRGSNLAP